MSKALRLVIADEEGNVYGNFHGVEEMDFSSEYDHKRLIEWIAFACAYAHHEQKRQAEQEEEEQAK